MARLSGFIEKNVVSGRTNKNLRDLDAPRSEYPYHALGESGFALCSAGVNKVLDVPSNQVFQLRKVFYAMNNSVALLLRMRVGGSVASAGSGGVIFLEPPQVTSGYQNQVPATEGFFVFSASQSTSLWASAQASTYVRVGGQIYDYADFE